MITNTSLFSGLNPEFHVPLRNTKDSNDYVSAFLMGSAESGETISIDQAGDVLFSKARIKLPFKDVIDLAKNLIEAEKNCESKERITLVFEGISKAYEQKQSSKQRSFADMLSPTESTKRGFFIKEAKEIIQNTQEKIEQLRELEQKFKDKEKQIHSIKKIFREYSFKKRISSFIQRRANFNKRQERGLHEEPLKIFDLKLLSLEADVSSQLKEWNDKNESLALQVGVSFTGRPEKRKILELLLQSFVITHSFLSVLNSMQSYGKKDSKKILKGVFDSDHKIQGLAFFKTGETRNFIIRQDGEERKELRKIPLYVALIGTSPSNLRIGIGAEGVEEGGAKRVEGAGTSLIESAIYESLYQGTGGAVALESVPLARGFYEKMGFEEQNWERKDPEMIPMILSEERAMAFLASSRSGRALPG